MWVRVVGNVCGRGAEFRNVSKNGITVTMPTRRIADLGNKDIVRVTAWHLAKKQPDTPKLKTFVRTR